MKSATTGTLPSPAASNARPGLEHIGCSGWNYKSWAQHFYAEGLSPDEWLRHYASVFSTVEINGTFYRLPEGSTFANWRSQTPDSFTFAVKASRYLTHMKRLRDPVEPLARLFTRAAELGPKLGPVLYQLPPNMSIDLPRLESFLQALPPQVDGRPVQHVIEFREPSWYVRDVFDLLEQSGVTLCLHDKLGSRIAHPFVGPLVYVRFHGTSGRYHGSYPARRLRRWASVLAEHMQDGRKVHAYFNNDPDAVATSNAQELMALLRER